MNTNTPLTELETNLPLTELETNLPFTELETNLPFTELETNIPLTELETNIPFTELETNLLLTELETNIPFTELETNLPLTELETNLPLTELEISEIVRLCVAWRLGFWLSATGLSLQEASKGYLYGLSMNSNNFEIPQQDVPILPEACEPLLPLFLESEQAEILAAQTVNKLQAPMDYNAETIETEPCLQTDDSNDASGLISTPASPSILSTSTQVTTTGASDAPSNEEEGVNGLAMDMQTPESPGCSVTQTAIPPEPAQAPVYIDLTGEDEPSDGGIPASKTNSEGRRKRKHGHENVHDEQLPLSQARKRSKIERELGENELRLKTKEIVWETGDERVHQMASRDGHKWSSEGFMNDKGCIVEMEVIVNHGTKQTLRLSKTGKTDGQGMLWEADDGFGTCKFSLTSEDIESMVGKDCKSFIKECKYIERDKHIEKYI